MRFLRGRSRGMSALRRVGFVRKDGTVYKPIATPGKETGLTLVVVLMLIPQPSPSL